MGMFDDLRCEYPLPRPEMQGRTFQTKSLECFMWKYSITAEGRLVCHPHRLEPNPEWVAPAPDNKSFLALAGMFRSVPEPAYDTNHHGDIYFYDFDTADGGRWVDGKYDPGNLITFRARFTEGQLTSIIVVDDGSDD